MVDISSFFSKQPYRAPHWPARPFWLLFLVGVVSPSILPSTIPEEPLPQTWNIPAQAQIRAGGLTNHPRVPVGLCTLVTIANEQLTLAHWVTYHMMLGFSKVYLYIDDTHTVNSPEQTALSKEFALPFSLQHEVTVIWLSEVKPMLAPIEVSAEHVEEELLRRKQQRSRAKKTNLWTPVNDCYQRAGAEGMKWTAYFHPDEYMATGRAVKDRKALLDGTPMMFDIGYWVAKQIDLARPNSTIVLLPKLLFLNLNYTRTGHISGVIAHTKNGNNGRYFDGHYCTGIPGNWKSSCKKYDFGCEKGRTIARANIAGLIQSYHTAVPPFKKSKIGAASGKQWQADNFVFLGPHKTEVLQTSNFLNGFPTAGSIVPFFYEGLRLYKYYTRSVEECKQRRAVEKKRTAYILPKQHAGMRNQKAARKEYDCNPLEANSVKNDYSVAIYTEVVELETRRWLSAMDQVINPKKHGKNVKGSQSSRSFVLLLTSQRTGSSQLTRFLRRAGFEFEHEVLNRRAHVLRYVASVEPELFVGVELKENICVFRDLYLNHVCSITAEICGFKVFGSHLLPTKHRFDLVEQLLNCDPENRPKIISLERQDKKAQYLSYQEAMRTGNWGSSAREKKRAHEHVLIEPKEPLSEPEWKNGVQKWHAYINSLGEKGFEVFSLKTEELLDDKERTFAMLEDFLVGVRIRMAPSSQ